MSCRTLTALFVIAATLGSFALAQAPEALKQADQQPPPGHLERPNMPFVPVPRGTQATSPGMRLTFDRYVAVQVNVDANGNNIVGDAANEPSIAVNPLNPHNMVIGWRQFDTINSDFRQAGWGYTFDGGQTWTFPGKINPGVFRSDPVLDANPAGTIFYNSLTSDGTGFHCRVFRSFDGGVSWDGGVEAYGGDKQWMRIDPNPPGQLGSGNIYAYWTEWYSICNGQFTRSYNGGNTYLACTSIPGSPNWGTLDVGTDGTLYCIGDGFLFAKSTTMKDPNQPAAWQLNNTINLGGSLIYGTGPNPGGLLGQAWLAVDRSSGPTAGYLYACATVAPAGSDPADVMFARSTNGGQTWSSPIRLNDDPAGSNAWQWFGTLSVAPNGRIDVIWNDTRNHPGTYLSELFYTSSTDGGVTWTPNEQLTPAWNPHIGWPIQQKIGDYYHMRSDERGANLAFAATFNNEEDVYYMRIGEPLCSEPGTVGFDQSKFGCESTAGVIVSDCSANLNSDVVETVTVNVASTSEPAGESVVLTETGPATAQFTGTLTLSGTNAPGVLLVAPGDTLTATYVDLDNGSGQQVTVTGTAVVDCTPPVISNVHTINVQPHSATVVFNVDEPVRTTIHYGLTCGYLNQTATSTALNPWPQIDISGLNDNTTYYYAVEAQDEAGNIAYDNNGGSCYTFTTPQVPDYFTELFTGACDLGNKSLIFTPNGSSDFYLGCVESITALPTDPTGGTTLTLSDDSYATVNIGAGATVKLYGATYNHFYVGSNGYITFTTGDSTYTPSLAAHFNQPRISALFDDLNPASGGTVSWKQLSDRVAVTWLNVPEVSGGISTCQIEMYFNGLLRLNYLAVGTSGSLAGLSAGGGTPPSFFMSDLSAMGPCQTYPPNAQNSTVSTNENTLVNITLVATDDGMPYPPGVLTYIVTSLPSHGSLADPGAGAISSVPYTLVNYGKIVRYTPASHYVGSDSFQFKANDSGTPPDGGDSNIATVTINVIGVPELVYSFPLDTSPGWAVTGAWAFGHPTGAGSHNKDPNNGYTGTNVYGYNLTGDYTNNLTPKYLTTTALNCATLTGVEVRFWRWLGVEATDHAGIEVSNNGSTWTQVWANSSLVSEAAWSHQVVPLGTTADHQATVSVRWVMGPTDVSVTYPGWNIDDVEIWALVPPPSAIGDMNCDGTVDFGDINPFVLALTNPAQYPVLYPNCNIMNGDINQDGSVDFGDINPFVQLLTAK